MESIFGALRICFGFVPVQTRLDTSHLQIWHVMNNDCWLLLITSSQSSAGCVLCGNLEWPPQRKRTTTHQVCGHQPVDQQDGQQPWGPGVCETPMKIGVLLYLLYTIHYTHYTLYTILNYILLYSELSSRAMHWWIQKPVQGIYTIQWQPWCLEGSSNFASVAEALVGFTSETCDWPLGITFVHFTHTHTTKMFEFLGVR